MSRVASLPIGKLATLDIYFLMANVSAPGDSLKLCIFRCCLAHHKLHSENLKRHRLKLLKIFWNQKNKPERGHSEE